MDILFQRVYGDFALWQVAAGAIVVLVILFVLKTKLFAKKSNRQHNVGATCGGCGWVGSISRHSKRCPSCNGPLQL